MDVTVLICTYNRDRLLADTLDTLAAMQVEPSLRWEVIVVDNNSNDSTRQVTESRITSYPVPLRWIFEGRQGKAHALKTGIQASGAAIIAFTDDDVQVPRHWLAAAVAPLLARPDIEYTGGPVHPIWEAPPPAWIDGDPGVMWGPLALLDYGPDSFVFEDRYRIPLGVNMAARRTLIDRVGGFHPALERKGTSLMGQGQAEFFFRTRAAGARGLYVPDMVLRHHVPAARMRREYYRRWWFWKGIARARMQGLHAITELGVNLASVPQVARVPRFMWGSAVRDVSGLIKGIIGGSPARRAEHEMMLTYFAGYVADRWRNRSIAPAPAPAVPEKHPVISS
jgi:glycosyltransferase involved in cell wall biosynthesis